MRLLELQPVRHADVAKPSLEAFESGVETLFESPTLVDVTGIVLERQRSVRKKVVVVKCFDETAAGKGMKLERTDEPSAGSYTNAGVQAWMDSGSFIVDVRSVSSNDVIRRGLCPGGAAVGDMDSWHSGVGLEVVHVPSGHEHRH